MHAPAIAARLPRWNEAWGDHGNSKEESNKGGAENVRPTEETL